MTTQAILDQTKRDFTYVSDGGKDRWTLGPEQGPFTGDCEEFALTLLLRLYGPRGMWVAIKNREAIIERVISDRGNGHAVLWVKGAGYVDSTHQYWRPDRLFKDSLK